LIRDAEVPALSPKMARVSLKFQLQNSKKSVLWQMPVKTIIRALIDYPNPPNFCQGIEKQRV